MAGILWLASYPKSGNTWLRIFLANLFDDSKSAYDINKLGRFFYGEMSSDLYERVAGKPVAELSDVELHQLRPRVHRLLANLRAETVMAKTHNAMAMQGGVATITPDVTAGAIYVVRNPLDIVLSYADHYGLSIDSAIEAMASPENHVATSRTAVFQHLGAWGDHVRSWTRAPGLHLQIVRYEDLVNKPIDAFGDVVDFVGVKATRGRLRRAIRNASFNEMKRQETQHGFDEKSRHAASFFREGKNNQWREKLAADQVERMIEVHGEVMGEFGYLP